MSRDETRPGGTPQATPDGDRRLRPYVTPAVGTAPADSGNQRRSDPENRPRDGARDPE